jgi:hypothetical protein
LIHLSPFSKFTRSTTLSSRNDNRKENPVKSNLYTWLEISPFKMCFITFSEHCHNQEHLPLCFLSMIRENLIYPIYIMTPGVKLTILYDWLLIKINVISRRHFEWELVWDLFSSIALTWMKCCCISCPLFFVGEYLLNMLHSMPTYHNRDLSEATFTLDVIAGKH